MKNLLSQYNHPDTLLVITSYPNPDNGKYGERIFNAVGEHSERRLPYIAKNRKVLVLAEDIGTTSEFSPTSNILVERIWKKGNVPSLIKLARLIMKLDQINSILVQFEFNVLGGNKANLVLLFILMLLKLKGKKITFEMHQVLTDIGSVKRHININNPILQVVYNLGLRIFYTVVGLITDKIIVFEEEMKIRLKKFVKASKIEVLCLSVDKQKTIDKNDARKKLNMNQKEFVLLVFGFINGYKGIEWIMEALKGVEDKNVRLVIAGGKNPYLINKPFYQKFYQSIVDEASKQAHVTYADFVPEDKVYLYFSASDLVVMPYTAFMAASGPFSRALAYEKPIIISEKLSDYSKSADFVKALKDSNLTQSDVVFPLKKSGLLNLVQKAQNDSMYYNSLKQFSKSLAGYRNIENITRTMDAVMFEEKQLISPRSLLSGLIGNFSMRATALSRRISANT